jgi:hypothetical protein
MDARKHRRIDKPCIYGHILNFGGCARTAANEILAEGVGFEPTIRFPVYTLSKRAPSATRPSLRGSRGRNIVEVGGVTTRAGGLISASRAVHDRA